MPAAPGITGNTLTQPQHVQSDCGAGLHQPSPTPGGLLVGYGAQNPK